MKRKCNGFLSPGTKQTVRINAVSVNERGLTVKAKERQKSAVEKEEFVLKRAVRVGWEAKQKTSVPTTNI